MGIDENSHSSLEDWQEARERQALFCLGNFLPGKALERWWVYGMVSYDDSRTDYRHTFGSRFEYDGRFPVPNNGAIRSRRARLQHLHARGVYLKFLKWGKKSSALIQQPYLAPAAFRRPTNSTSNMNSAKRH
ncbi:MAG: hypothetical protein ACK2T3_09590 [Candidatus Promineifilaceae bacterium]|jgi:hypothetical protein